MTGRWSRDAIRFLRDASAYTDYNRTLAQWIRPFLAPDSHICDAGCGLGYLSLELARIAGRVTAIEQDENALAVLQQNCVQHGLSNVETRCGDIHCLPPAAPYDAMVFCFFGRIEEILHIARQQCRGQIFVVVRDYAQHRFSANTENHGRSSSAEYEALLQQKGIPFTAARCAPAFGQPLRTLADARTFYRLYTRPEHWPDITDAFLQGALQPIAQGPWRYYLPRTRPSTLIHFLSSDIP